MFPSGVAKLFSLYLLHPFWSLFYRSVFSIASCYWYNFVQMILVYSMITFVCSDIPRKRCFQHLKDKKRQRGLQAIPIPIFQWGISLTGWKNNLQTNEDSTGWINKFYCFKLRSSCMYFTYAQCYDWLFVDPTCVYNHQVDPAQVSALSKVPSQLTKEELTSSLSTIDGLPLCCGQYDFQYIEMLRTKKR